MGLPLAMDMVPVWYNKEVFEKYGVKPPKTWDELMQAIETFKKNGVIPIALANKTKWTGAFYLMYFADRVAGEELFQNAVSREGSFADPGYVKAGEYIQKLVKAGAFPEGFNGLDEDTGQSRQLFYSGKAAMYVNGSWFLNIIRDENPEMEKKVGFFPFPTVPDGKGDPSNLVGGVSPVYSISASCKYPDLAVELLKELTSEETIKTFAEHRGAIPALKGVEVDDPFVEAAEGDGGEGESPAGLLRSDLAARAGGRAQKYHPVSVRSQDDAGRSGKGHGKKSKGDSEKMTGALRCPRTKSVEGQDK